MPVDYPYVHLVRGALLEELGRLDEALASLALALKVATNEVERDQLQTRIDRIKRAPHPTGGVEMNANEMFWSLAAELQHEDPRIIEGTIMNGRCLRVGKEFLALVDYKGSGLVVKLPRRESMSSFAPRRASPSRLRARCSRNGSPFQRSIDSSGNRYCERPSRSWADRTSADVRSPRLRPRHGDSHQPCTHLSRRRSAARMVSDGAAASALSR
jgi:hypothetical protein